MKKILFLLGVLFISATAVSAEPTFTLSGNTWLQSGIPIGDVTISAASTDCGGWTGTSVVNGPLISTYALEIPQACHNLQVTAFRRGYHFTPDVWSFTFPTTQTNPIGPRDFIVNQ